MIGLAPWGAPAQALQPLETFTRAARLGNPENREAQATRAQRDAEATAALGQNLPNLAASASYTRNQYEVRINLSDGRAATVTPYDQLSATFSLNVPLIDLSSFAASRAARTSARASELDREATTLTIESTVVENYYELIANFALVQAAEAALEVAERSAAISAEKLAQGTAAALDVERAAAEVEKQRKQLAAAELSLALSERALQSVSGVSPDLSAAPALEPDDLHEEAPFETFAARWRALPAVASAKAAREAAQENARAKRLALAPVLSAAGSESLTNAPGLTGREASFKATVSLGWSLDVTSFADARAQEAAAAAAEAREEASARSAYDALHRAFHQVQSNIAQLRSARAQARASGHAAELALERYRVGASTQLELQQAQRDAFDAEVGRIAADAELANARIQLRLSAALSRSESAEPPASTGGGVR